MFFNKRKIAQQQRRAREKALKDMDAGPALEAIARLAGIIFLPFVVIPFQAFYRKTISRFWKFFYKILNVGFYVIIYQTFSDEGYWKEFADASGEIYEKVPAYDYISYFALLMIGITIFSFFKKKSSKSIANQSSNKTSMTAEVDEIKEGYFIANVNVPKGVSVPDSSIESIKQQVTEAMEAEGEEVIEVTVKLSNAKKRSRTITQEVKDRVWNRDGGKCVECGSNENLEFDHIIPFSKGGANTYRNIQLLCEPCNRKKSANIG